MKQFRNMALPYIVWSAVMIILPMLLIVMYAFTQKGNDDLSNHAAKFCSLLQ